MRYECSKCTIGVPWCQVSTIPGPCCLSELPCGTYMCHNEGEQVEVLEGFRSCGSGFKSVHMRYECSSNLVSIGHQIDAPWHCMTVRQNHVYAWWIKNGSKCTIGVPWCQVSTTPGPCCLSELPCGTYVCHNEGEQVEVLEGFRSCGSRVKSVHMRYECSPNLVSIGHQIDAPWHRMTVRQNHIYAWWIKNGSKCTVGVSWCQVSTTPRPCCLSELSCGTYVCHNEGERVETSISGDFLSNKFFKDSIRRHRCADIASQPACRRLLHTLTIRYGICKWHGMDTGGPMPQYNSNGWMFETSRWDERHVGPFSMAWPSKLWWLTIPWDSGWCQDMWVMSMGIEMTRWEATLHWETLALSKGKVEHNDLALCRGKLVVSQTIEHAHADDMCGWTRLDFAPTMFDWWRQTLPKVLWSHKVKIYIYGT